MLILRFVPTSIFSRILIREGLEPWRGLSTEKDLKALFTLKNLDFIYIYININNVFLSFLKMLLFICGIRCQVVQIKGCYHICQELVEIME